MAVNETRIRVSLIDNMSGTLTHLNSKMDSFTRNIQGVGNNGANSFAKMSKEVSSLTGSFDILRTQLVKVSGLIKALGTVYNVGSTMIGGSYEYAKSMELNAVGIAGILASMTKLGDKQTSWNDAMAISKDIVKQLKDEALQTSATAEDLLGTFRAILGPGLAAGMKIDEILKFTSTGVNAVKSLGLDSNQLIQELRDLVQGGIRPASSTLATSLGITDSDIKAAKASSEGLYKFLTDRMKGYQYSTKETAQTMYGQMEILKQAYLEVSSTVADKVFNSFRDTVKKFNDILLVQDSETGRYGINQAIVKAFEEAGYTIDTIFTKIVDLSTYASERIWGVAAALGAAVLPKVLGTAGEYFSSLVIKVTEVVNSFSSYEKYLRECTTLTNALAEANQKNAQEVAQVTGMAKTYNSILASQDAVLNSRRSANKKTLKDNLSSIESQHDLYKSLKKKEENIEKIADRVDKKFKNTSQKVEAATQKLVQCGYSQAEAYDMNYRILKAYSDGEKEFAEKLTKAIDKEVEDYQRRNKAMSVKDVSNDLVRQQEADNQKMRSAIEARAKASVIGNAEEAKSLQQLINKHNAYVQELRNAKVPQEQINALEQAFVERLDKVTKGLSTADAELKRYNDNIRQVHGKLYNFGKGLINLTEGLSKFSGALSSAGMLLLTFGDAEDETTKHTADVLFSIDIAISSLGTLCGALRDATKWWKEYKEAQGAAKIADLLTLGAGFGKAGLIAGGIGALAAGTYAYFDPDIHDWNDIVNRYTGKRKQTPQEQLAALAKAPLTRTRLAAGGKATKSPDMNNLSTLFSKNEDTSKANKEAEKAAKVQDQYEKLVATINKTTYALNENNDAYKKTMNEAEEKTASWKKTYNAWYRSGQITKKQYDDIVALTSKYSDEMERSARAAQRQQELSRLSLREEQARLTIALGGSQAGQYDAVNKVLVERKEYLEQALLEEQDNIQKRIELQKDYAATVKSIRDNDMYDMKTAWKAALEEISLQQVNFGEGVKSVFSSIQSAGVTLLSSTASFSEKVATFFESITQSILENMAKMLMQGLITNAILSAFGGGGTTIGIGSANLTSSFSSTSSSLSMPAGIGVKAKGGYASGWNIVGEQGPELVNFSNPARVYTAQQTANALGNTGGNVNIKIDLKNESGQQMQAETTGTSFDGESYIVGVVLKAISTNKNGIRTVLRGV